MSITLSVQQTNTIHEENNILISKLEENFKQLEVLFIQNEVDPSEIHAATQTVVQDEIWHLINSLKANSNLLIQS